MRAKPPPITSPPWDPQTKRTVALIVLFVVGLTVIRLGDILPLMLVAVVLSYLLNPVATFIERRILFFGPFRKRSSRGLAVLLAIVLAFLFLFLIALLILPVLITQARDLGQSIPRIIDDVEAFLVEQLSKPLSFRGEEILIDGEPVIPLERLRESLGAGGTEGALLDIDNLDLLGAAQSLLGSAGRFSGTAFDFVGGAVSSLINITLLLSLMGYLMADGHRIVERIVETTPATYRSDVRRLFYELGRVWDAYLRGQLIQSVLIGTLVFAAATLLGLPNAPILGLLSGLGEFIPTIGAFIALAPAVLLAFFSESGTIAGLAGPPFALVVALVWTLGIQQFGSLYLQPRIMGGSLNLHPLVIIVAVIAGANIAGALGVLLAAPVMASLRVFAVYLYGKMTDRNPFPEREAGAEYSEAPRFSPRWLWRAVRQRWPGLPRGRPTGEAAGHDVEMNR